MIQQPIIKDSQGNLRFRGNVVITKLFDQNPQLSLMTFYNKGYPIADLEQVAMLMGLTLTEFCALPFVSKETIDKLMEQL